MYQALYRKWRPKTFDDVVGQQHVTDTLKRQVLLDRLSHAKFRRKKNENGLSTLSGGIFPLRKIFCGTALLFHLLRR